jgi:hypothetical protein
VRLAQVFVKIVDDELKPCNGCALFHVFKDRIEWHGDRCGSKVDSVLGSLWHATDGVTWLIVGKVSKRR